MPLRSVRFSDPAEFAKAVRPRLMENEAANCLLLSFVERVLDRGYAPFSEKELDRPLMIAALDGDAMHAVGVWFVKTYMFVSGGSPEAIVCLAGGIAGPDQPHQVFGPVPSVGIFADECCGASSRSKKLKMVLSTFVLDRVVRPRPAPGAMRICDPIDREQVARFQDEFAESIGEPNRGGSLENADRLIRDRRIFFWVDGEPVAMAGFAGPTPNGVRINAVYTPPQFRGRGYASNLVAALSQRNLDERRAFCFLHTDRSNPTSNSIYKKLGYRHVCDSERWEMIPTGREQQQPPGFSRR